MSGYPTIIAGPRTYLPDVATIQRAVDLSGLEVGTLVCGMAPGVDTVAWRWAKGHDLPCLAYPAPWGAQELDYPGRVVTRRDGTRYHTGAGGWRNREMARYCQAHGGQLLALWDGRSTGTSNMIGQARTHGLPLVIYWITTGGYDRVH